MPIGVTFLTPQQVRQQRNAIRQVYFEAFADPPYSRSASVADSFLNSLAHNLERPAFRLAAATGGNGATVGFAYGHASEPGQWWHDLVALVMPQPRAAEWLAGAFELVEFAVLPPAQGQGIGRRLHDHLLGDLPHHTAVLSTLQAETLALRLYRRWGWVVLLEDFLFPGGSKPYLIMGLDLHTWRSNQNLPGAEPAQHPRC